MSELKLPLSKEKGLIGGGWMILDNDGKILSHIGAPAFAQRRIVTEDEIDAMITACNDHADLTVNVSELKYVLEQRNQEKAALQAEVERLREVLKSLNRLAKKHDATPNQGFTGIVILAIEQALPPDDEGRR